MEAAMEKLIDNNSVDIYPILINVSKSLQSGEFLNNPAMVLALVLLGSAIVVLLVCIAAIFFRSSSSDNESNYHLQTRIQALEIALSEQRNIALGLKNQNKADFAYFKQEMKNLYAAIEGLEAGKSSSDRGRPFLRAANSDLF